MFNTAKQIAGFHTQEVALVGTQRTDMRNRLRIPTIPRRDTDMITRIVPI